MMWFKKSVGQEKHSCVLVVEGPRFGPVGQEQLTAIVEAVCTRLTAKYGDRIENIEPIISLDVGATMITITTKKTTIKEGEQIASLCRQWLYANTLDP